MTSDNPCKGCIHFKISLKTNPEGKTCEDLELSKKCTFYVDVDTLDSRRDSKIANALMSAKTSVVSLKSLHKLLGTLVRDRSKAMVGSIQLGSWITFMRAGETRRERAGFVNAHSGSGFLLVGTEFDPVRVTPDRILKIEPPESDNFMEFRVYTTKQRQRINQIRKRDASYKSHLKTHKAHRTQIGSASVTTVYDPKKMTVVSAASGNSLTEFNASMVPNMVDATAWLNKHIYKREAKVSGRKLRYRPTKYAVYGNDVVHQFYIDHALDTKPNYLDLGSAGGTHEFVMFVRTINDAEDLRKWLIARYHADGYPKEGPERFVIIDRHDAFKMARYADEGKFPEAFFWFAQTAPGYLLSDIDYLPREEYTTKAGKKKLRKAKPRYLGRACQFRKQDGDNVRSKLNTRGY